MGAAGKTVKVNHGYARNFLVPNRLAVAMPLPRRGQPAADAASSRGPQQRQEQHVAQSSSTQLNLEKQQQQFDKLLKVLTSSTLVRAARRGIAAALHCCLSCCV